jgi:hypothetical protein
VYRDAHIAYWKARNTETDPKRFEDGFIQGWCDAEDMSYPDINRDSLLSQRKNENIEHCGNSPVEWAFEHGCVLDLSFPFVFVSWVHL